MIKDPGDPMRFIAMAATTWIIATAAPTRTKVMAASMVFLPHGALHLSYYRAAPMMLCQ